MLAWCGYVGIFASVAHAVLQHFHLTEFSPVVDTVIGVICPTAGAVMLHKAEPPK